MSEKSLEKKRNLNKIKKNESAYDMSALPEWLHRLII